MGAAGSHRMLTLELSQPRPWSMCFRRHYAEAFFEHKTTGGSMFRSWSLNLKLGATFAFLFVIMAGLAGYTYHSLKRVENDSVELVDRVMVRMTLALEMDSLTNQIRNLEKVAILENTPEKIRQAEKRTLDAAKSVEDLIATYYPWHPSRDEKIWMSSKRRLASGAS
jgi:Four helix bundle sensory module for signal transduction